MSASNVSISWLTRAATDPSRSRRQLLGALLVLSALATGLSGLGHHHSESELYDDDHCAVCHAQQSTHLTDPIAKITSLATLWGDTPLVDQVPQGSASYRLGPPRRGPPAS